LDEDALVHRKAALARRVRAVERRVVHRVEVPQIKGFGVRAAALRVLVARCRVLELDRRHPRAQALLLPAARRRAPDPDAVGIADELLVVGGDFGAEELVAAVGPVEAAVLARARELAPLVFELPDAHVRHDDVVAREVEVVGDGLVPRRLDEVEGRAE